MKYITKEVRIGIAGIAALCILVYGINYLKGINLFKPSSYFYVKFHNVNGLTKSSPVFADGFRVGIVRDLYYDYTQPGKVIAEIDVNTDLRIPKGSTAELAAEMLGGVKMNLLLANNPREISDWRYDSRHPQQRNDGKGSFHDAATGKDAAQAGLHPRLFKHSIGRPGHTGHPAQCAEPDSQPGRNQRAAANINEQGYSSAHRKAEHHRR